MVSYSKVRYYKEKEVNLDEIFSRAEAILRKKPFQWQLEAAMAVLCGQDVIVDVGTGSGKTLCFFLPLLLPQDQKDISIVIAPYLLS